MNNISDELNGLSPDQRKLFELLLQQKADLAKSERLSMSTAESATNTSQLVPLTPPQDWLLKTIITQPEKFTINTSIEVYQPLNMDLLRETLRHLLIQHDSLRARFVFNGQKWQQFIEPADAVTPFLITRDISAFPPERQQELIIETVYELQDNHSLGVAPLVQIAYLNLGPTAPACLALSFHHLVVDGFSMFIITEDFQQIYGQLAYGQPVSLPVKKHSFKDYAEQLTQYVRSVAQREVDYWLSKPWNLVKPLPMDTPEGRAEDTFGREESLLLELNMQETNELLKAVKAVDGANIKDFLLTGLALAFKQWGCLDVLFVRFEHLGRKGLLDEFDLSSIVGWMATVSDIFLEVGESNDSRTVLNGIIRQTSNLPMDGLGLGFLEYLTGDPEYAALTKPVLSLPTSHVFFNYLGKLQDTQPSMKSVFGKMREVKRQGDSQRNNPLEFRGGLGEKGLTLKVAYGPSVYSRTSIEKLVALYKKNLLALAKDNTKSSA